VIHGAVLLTTVGGALGATSGRLAAGLPIGTAAGVAGAGAYYALRPAIGSVAAMIVAWSSLWVMLSVLDGRLVRRPARSWTDVFVRGLVAAALGAAAFGSVVGLLWGRAPAGGRNYAVQFGAWLIAWAPSLLVLAWPRRTPGES
jgi:hypothetical protein